MGLFNAKKRRAEREEAERRDRIRSDQRMQNSDMLDSTNINSPLNPVYAGTDVYDSCDSSSSTDCSSGDSGGGSD